MVDPIGQFLGGGAYFSVFAGGGALVPVVGALGVYGKSTVSIT